MFQKQNALTPEAFCGNLDGQEEAGKDEGEGVKATVAFTTATGAAEEDDDEEEEEEEEEK